MTELINTDWLVIAVAAYAAIVATGALALEVRRWFESGARLKIHIMPEAETFNMPGTEDKTYLVATVTNRGNAPTTITHFALRDYGSWLGRLRSKPTWTVVIPSPQPPGTTSIIPKSPTRNELSVFRLLPTCVSGAERWRGRAMPRRWRWSLRSPWPGAGCG